jgi:glycosyltransferase involved in cell wall biosynthesis
MRRQSSLPGVAEESDRRTLTNMLHSTAVADSEALNISPELLNRLVKQPLLADVGVIALVPDEWDALWQPRHHVVSRLARYFQVVWVNPAKNWREMLKGESTLRPSDLAERAHKTTAPGFVVYSPQILLSSQYRVHWLDNFLMQQRLKKARNILTRRGCQRIILYIWRPRFSSALKTIPFDLSCYHIDDEYSFSSVELPLGEIERQLIHDVDQVILHSPGLLEKKGNINPHTLYVPNGVDYEAYSRVQPEPLDLASIPHPRIGYTGFIKRHLDWQVLLRLSQEHRGWSFVFVGPQSPHDDIVPIIQELTKLPNVHFLGPKPTRDLCAYPQYFDVCIMPYQANDYTKYVYPLKLHEYLATGRPTVGSRIRTLCEFTDVLTLASTCEEWSSAIEDSLKPEANSPERRAARQEIARRYDWEGLVLRIASSMAEGLGQEYAGKLSRLLGTGGKTQSDLNAYRASPREQERISDLLAVTPKGYASVLDVGARDGYISNLLASHFASVTALDLEEPQVSNDRVLAVKGDITHLEYPDNAFDVVVCTEVLEHIPPQLLARACSEIGRVAKYGIVIGVPYRQDRRLGATTCVFCGKQNPCWGHVNDFDEARLKCLFERLLLSRTSFVGRTKERTNFVSAYLMGKAGNPWGTYEQDESCVYCGNQMIPPAHRTMFEAFGARLASILNDVQSQFAPLRPIWIHMVFKKADPIPSPSDPSKAL